MSWQASIIVGFLVCLLGYFIGRYQMGKVGEEFITRLLETLNEPTDITVRQTIKVVLKYYKQWNKMRRFL